MRSFNLFFGLGSFILFIHILRRLHNHSRTTEVLKTVSQFSKKGKTIHSVTQEADSTEKLNQSPNWSSSSSLSSKKKNASLSTSNSILDKMKMLKFEASSLRALIGFSFPVQFFFYFLYYTDAAATFFVLLSYFCALNNWIYRSSLGCWQYFADRQILCGWDSSPRPSPSQNLSAR
jgi:hypothetical protein